MLNNIQLTDTAKDYAQNCLRQGGKYADSLTNISSGRITAFLPSQLDYSHVDYSRSLHLTFGVQIYEVARQNIYEMVNSFLQSGINKYALVETYYNSRDLKKMPSLPNTVYSENEILFLLKPHASIQEIKNAFSSARDYPFVCGLIDLNGADFSLLENQNIQSERWNTLAQKTQYIIIGAFDNEGFLIWEVEH